MNPPRHLLHLAPGVEMAFRLIPAGSFRMGSRGYLIDEEPVHVVVIPQDFWLGETPVTQAQFKVWTKATGVDHKNHFDGCPNHPAENLDWRQANAFCAWLAQFKAALLPQGFSQACLPTEAEWEYACRAGSTTEYYSGDGAAALVEAGWYGEEVGNGGTHPVGQKSPNAFQLLELHGNVWEWCHDRWDASAYRQRGQAKLDPGFALRCEEWSQGLSIFEHFAESRVLRGGSWIVSAFDCRSAYRGWYEPGGRRRRIGFRVCLVRGPVKDE